MSRETPPAPRGWNKTIKDLMDESAESGSAAGPPEVDWALDYERSLLPAGTRFPKKGDVYEASEDVEVNYLSSWSAPFTGGGMGKLKNGDRVIVDYDILLPRPVAVYARPIEYAAVEERMVPASDRANVKYAGFYLCLRTADLSLHFRLVHEESTPADYQKDGS